VSEPVPFKYRAFLSYSHRDKTWGKWLHAALEGYRIDKDLAGRDTPAGRVPKTLRPIFRDREDFSAQLTIRVGAKRVIILSSKFGPRRAQPLINSTIHLPIPARDFAVRDTPYTIE
jgi:hypothetical protein